MLSGQNAKFCRKEGFGGSQPCSNHFAVRRNRWKAKAAQSIAAVQKKAQTGAMRRVQTGAMQSKGCCVRRNTLYQLLRVAAAQSPQCTGGRCAYLRHQKRQCMQAGGVRRHQQDQQDFSGESFVCLWQLEHLFQRWRLIWV